MKVKDIIAEAKMDPGIRKNLEQRGYKFLGKGQDQDVYLAPDGTILKIFGTDEDAKLNMYSEGQRSVIDFIKFCQNHPDNPFLPTFGGFTRFKFKDKYYVQISCERLFDFGGAEALAQHLEHITNSVEDYGVQRGMQRLGREFTDPKSVDKKYRKEVEKENDARAQLILLLGGEQRTKLLLTTIKQLASIAKQKRYGFDLHKGNFMLGSDGEIVINDPFFTGTWR
jgi:hypothetical protein